MSVLQRPKSSRTAPARGQNAGFAFPNSHHLIITTPKHVHAVDKAGSRKIFKSGSEGILAAKEAKNGSGTLAISDSQNVILHRIEDGQEKSYRLKGGEGQIRLLEFASDSKTLFFTTTLLNAVQTYSLPEARLLEPGPLHNSAPTVVAISSLSHILLTASEDPPVVYLQNRTMGTQPLMHQPLASQAPVVQACFHPDRPSMFLLAFKDGTVAAYDATQLFRSVGKGDGCPQAIGGELHVFKHLHAVNSRGVVDPGDYFSSAALGDTDLGTNIIGSGARSMGVTGLAFLPGQRSRAATCGADGKCRVIDFEKGCTIRSWHARAPATCLSVLSTKSTKTPLIAIGKIDGKVAIHDISGALLHEFRTEEAAIDRIIDVEWIKGQCPKEMGDSLPVKMVEETWIELYAINGTLRSRKTRSSEDAPDLQHEDVCSGGSSISASHSPVVEDTGTVCRHPVDFSRESLPSGMPGGTYMDLFSPVKPRQSPPAKAPNSPQRRAVTRQRPRISSSTFVNQGVDQRVSHSLPDAIERQVPPTIDERTSSPPNLSSEQTTTSLISPGFPSFGTNQSNNSDSTRDSATTKILADIKRHGTSGAAKGTPGSLALFAPYLPPPKGTTKKKPGSNSRRVSRSRKLSILSSSPMKASPEKKTSIPGREKRTADGEDDIWLTAESDAESNANVLQIRKEPREEKVSRRLKWPAERALSRQPVDDVLVSQRPSIALPMSPPVTRDLSTNAAQRQLNVDVRRSQTQKSSRAETQLSTAFSETATSNQPGDDTGDETVIPGSPLPPGFAQSYQGPVSVDRYLPRKSSLAFPSSPPGSPKRRPALEDISGNEQRGHEYGIRKAEVHDEKTCQCCSRMKSEIQILRDELAELRNLVKGKGRVD